MPFRYREVYNIFGVYAGSSPATGYHFEDYNQIPHNNSNLTIFDSNRIKPLDRIFNLEYGFSIDRQNITQLGTRGLTKRVIVTRPDIQLNFDYYIAGVRNENNLGLNVNYLDVENNPIYTEDICAFKNLTGYDTDGRNIFVAICPDDNDLNNRIYSINSGGDIRPQDLFVYGFGNCYLNSYRVQAAIGTIPQASVSYICDNMMAYSSGSGANVPAVLPKTGELVPNVKFVIPPQITVPTPSVIRNSDIEVSILQSSEVFASTSTELYLFNISTNLYNKIYISGNEDNENIVIENGQSLSTGAQSGIYSGIFLYNTTTNDFNQIISSGANGTQNLIVYSGITGGFPNAVPIFPYLLLQNITNNQTVQLNTTGNYNNENVIIYDTTGSVGSLFNTTYPIDATFGTNTQNIPIQSFNLSVDLQREDLRTIGYVLPLDRKLNFPIFVSFDFSTIVGENQTGNLPNFLRQDKDYDFLVNMYNHTCDTGREVGIQYKIMGAKLENINYGISTTNKLIANFAFLAEIDIENQQNNLFISGLLNEPFPEFPYDFLRLETNKTGFLLTEDNNLIVL